MNWLVPTLVAAVAVPILLPLGSRSRQETNYRGRPVALGGGPVVTVGAAAGWLVYYHKAPAKELGLLLFGVLVMTVLGLVDDYLGQKQVKGMRGHLRQWWHGASDTALAKAAGGLAVGLLVGSEEAANWGEILLDVLTVALAANALNLLDLRPGRALKGFGLGLLFLAVFGAGTLPHLLPLLAAALVYAPYDLRERLMLGDAGANALGVALGIGAAMGLAWPAKLGFAGGLGMLHWYAERGSISRLVERVGWLALLDRLGRRL